MEEKNHFDSELQTYFTQIKQRIKQQHSSYIKSHAELRQILNDFLSSILLQQPDNVYTYAQKYFSFFNHQKDKKTYRPLIISGCSGAGKGTLISKLLQKYPDIFELSISYTTRGPRVGQVHGREYYFVTIQEFKKEISRNVLAQYCQVHGNFYGTHKGKLIDIIQRGKICILDIDLKGAQKIHDNFDPCNYIFIDVPSLVDLEKRLKGRGTQTEEAIKKRIKNAQQQQIISKKLDYYHHIVNDKLQNTFKQVLSYIQSLYPELKF